MKQSMMRELEHIFYILRNNDVVEVWSVLGAKIQMRFVPKCTSARTISETPETKKKIVR